MVKKKEENIEVTEDFGLLLDEFMGKGTLQGKVVSGTVTAIDDDEVVVDVGLKSEGRIPLAEFGVTWPLYADQTGKSVRRTGD